MATEDIPHKKTLIRPLPSVYTASEAAPVTTGAALRVDGGVVKSAF